MPKLPSMSSKKLVRLLEKGGVAFVRQGSTDHAIYSRIADPAYCKRVLKQLRFTNKEIENLLR